MLKRALLAAAFIAVPVGAQDLPRNCNLVFTNTPATRLNLIKLPSGKYNTYSGGGVVGHCSGQNNQVTADSAEYYEEQGLLYLIGNVHYTEPRAKVDARRMTYFQSDDHLHAEGDVVGVFSNGSTMHGPVADYYRATAQRPVSRLIAPNHPVFDIVQVDTTGRKAPEKAHVVANLVIMDGDSLTYASGQVQLTRPDLVAKGDSAFLDGARNFARLMRSPSVEGKGDRQFTLTGDVIDIYSSQREIDRVVAAPHGHALSKDIELVSDTIDLRFSENAVQHATAWGPHRANAIAPDREIIADSIDALLPGQRIREVHAIRKAFANSVPDTATIISAERDWMMGDTIVALFDSLKTGDTTSRPLVRRVIASVDARSYFHTRSSNAPKNRPSVNYVRGREITALFTTGKVSTVVVTDQAAGVYIEPVTASSTRTTLPVSPPTRAPATPPAVGPRIKH